MAALNLYGPGRHPFVFFMYYVYILRSRKDDKLYIGYTTNLREKFVCHQKGLVVSTKFRRPEVIHDPSHIH